jgi:hypothetical protein
MNQGWTHKLHKFSGQRASFLYFIISFFFHSLFYQLTAKLSKWEWPPCLMFYSVIFN